MKKWRVSYTTLVGKKEFYSDEDLGAPGILLSGNTEADAIKEVKDYISELMRCNCLHVEEDENRLIVTEPSDGTTVEEFANFFAFPVYHLLDENGKVYESLVPGKLGGHRKLKIYGKLDCHSALRYINKGQYIKHRVFFFDEETAKKAGYRPCAICMPEEYYDWKKQKAIERRFIHDKS